MWFCMQCFCGNWNDFRQCAQKKHEKPTYPNCAAFSFIQTQLERCIVHSNFFEFPACNKDIAIIMWFYTMVTKSSVCTPHRSNVKIQWNLLIQLFSALSLESISKNCFAIAVHLRIGTILPLCQVNFLWQCGVFWFCVFLGFLMQ